MHAPYGVVHSYQGLGVPILGSAPQVKRIRMVTPFFALRRLHYFINNKNIERMKSKDFILFCVSAMLVSCGGTQFAITSSGENLSALTKVTDNEEPCISPYGGDNGRDLFFAACENKNYYNIYKKENPF